MSDAVAKYVISFGVPSLRAGHQHLGKAPTHPHLTTTPTPQRGMSRMLIASDSGGVVNVVNNLGRVGFLHHSSFAT